MGKYANRHGHDHADDTTSESEKPITRIKGLPSRRAQKPPAIIYHRSPGGQEERDRRLRELREYSQQAGLPWDALTPAEVQKKLHFGTRAKANTRKRVTLLTTITSGIVYERVWRYLESEKLSARQAKALESTIGFGDSDELLASNLAVRIAFADAFVRVMVPFFRRNKRLHFYFITVIHDGWHCLSSAPVLDLPDIRSRLRNVMQGKDMGWVGVIEVDALSNYPQDSEGRWLMPHVHMIAWTAVDWKPSELAADLCKSGRLVSAFGANTVVAKRINWRRNLIHLCYYLTKPPYQCKRLGAFNPKKGRHSMRPVLKHVPPFLTLAICRMLSTVNIKQLLLVSGTHGKAIRREVWDAVDVLQSKRRPRPRT